MDDKKNGRVSDKFKSDGMHPVYEPFWKNLPYCNIYSCITPDILHQLHIGVFHGHLVKWITEIIGKDELDARYKAVSKYPGLRHFWNGISLVKQWTGTEHKQMQRVFVGLLSGAVEDKVMKCVRALIDFIYYAQLQSHTGATLSALEASLESFHSCKDIFVQCNIRAHFDIPKLHSLLHYAASIRALGSLDGYNTELSERLHIEYAKKAYRASNKKDYTAQMTTWLRRQEAVIRRNTFLVWCNNTLVADCQKPVNDGDVEPSSDEEKSDDEPSQVVRTRSLSYKIAKQAPFPNLILDHLVERFGASQFLPALKKFLASRLKPRDRGLVPNDHDRFDAYRHINITLPSNRHLMDGPPRISKVRASPAVVRSSSDRRPGQSAHFDTALIVFDREAYMDKRRPEGLRVGRVRVIFDLPSHLGQYPHPLVYIEWFTELGRRDPPTGMNYISRSTRDGRRNTEIVGVESIVRACHLQGRMTGVGTRIDPTWTKSNVLEKADTFLVNPYILLDSFSSVLRAPPLCIPPPPPG